MIVTRQGDRVQVDFHEKTIHFSCAMVGSFWMPSLVEELVMKDPTINSSDGDGCQWRIKGAYIIGKKVDKQILVPI